MTAAVAASMGLCQWGCGGGWMQEDVVSAGRQWPAAGSAEAVTRWRQVSMLSGESGSARVVGAAGGGGGQGTSPLTCGAPMRGRGRTALKDPPLSRLPAHVCPGRQRASSPRPGPGPNPFPERPGRPGELPGVVSW